MKRFLITCLCACAALISTPIFSTPAAKFSKRIIDVTVITDVLLASSDSETGKITKVVIYNSSNQQVILQWCDNGYTCSVDVGDLPSGVYDALVVTELTSYTERFVK